MSVRSLNKINIPRRTALPPRVAGRPMSELSPAKLTLNGLMISMPLVQKVSSDLGLTNAYHSAASSPLIQKVSSDFSYIKQDLGVLASEVANDVAVYCSAHPYSTAGVLVGFVGLEVLLMMDRHQSPDFQSKLIDDPKTSLKKLIALCRKGKDANIRAKAIERCKDIPEKVLLKIVEKDSEPKVKNAVIMHKNFPDSAVLEQINKVQDKTAILKRLSSMSFSKEDLIRLLNNNDYETRKVLLHKLQLGNYKVSGETIQALYDFPYPDVKLAVLKMTEIPEDVFREAINSEYENIKLEAFSHKNMPGSLLKKHIKDKDSRVRSLVFEHRNTPSDAIANEFHLSYVEFKYSTSKGASSFDLSTITSVLKHHFPEKASEILDCLEKKDSILTENIRKSLAPEKTDTN